MVGRRCGVGRAAERSLCVAEVEGRCVQQKTSEVAKKSPTPVASMAQGLGYELHKHKEWHRLSSIRDAPETVGVLESCAQIFSRCVHD